MLDVKILRTQFEEVKEKLMQRGGDLTNIDRFEQLDKERRRLIAEVEELKSKRNDVSQQIAVLKREKNGRRAADCPNARSR